jgi:outer membrane immunogenic protein
MKNLFVTAIFLALVTVTFAQCPINKGQAQLNAGVGLSSWGIPVYVGLDYGIHKDITIGGEASFRSYNDNWGGNKYRHSVVGISGNGNYHFNSLLGIPTNWDLYAGLNIGFYYWSSPDNYGGTRSSGLGLGAQVGGRYYFSDKVGINLEFGGGNAFSGGKFGISIKL